MQDLQNLIVDLNSLRKNTRFQKKNRSNRSPDEGDIADLKISGVVDNFSGQRVLWRRSRSLGARSARSNCRSGIFGKKHMISKKKSVESESG